MDLGIWAQGGAWFIPRARYKGIADTIVQLIRRSTSGVMALSQPIRSEERRLEKTGLAAPLACQEKNDEHY